MKINTILDQIDLGAVPIEPEDVEQLMPDKGKWNTALHECCV